MRCKYRFVYVISVKALFSVQRWRGYGKQLYLHRHGAIKIHWWSWGFPCTYSSSTLTSFVYGYQEIAKVFCVVARSKFIGLIRRSPPSMIFSLSLFCSNMNNLLFATQWVFLTTSYLLLQIVQMNIWISGFSVNLSR